MELYDVFISYRRSDGRKTAEALYKYLTTKGLRVFWDIEKMEYGEAFPMQLEQAIVRAPTYVLVVTEDVFRFRQETETEKDYVRHEIRTALKAAEGRKEERPLCILDPVDGYFPNKDQLPGDVRDIADVHRIPLEENQEEAFQKVLALATRVTCSNLWNAAHRWFYGSKEADGRFARLNICEGILPNVDRQHHQTDIPIYTSIASHDGDPEDTLPLLDALGRTEGHLYLIGEGGIGKTTALMHIMSGAYEHSVYTPGTVIPLFVELSFAPDTPGPLYDTQVASFIRRSVYRQLRTDLQFLQDPTWGESSEDVFNLPDEVAVEPITKLFNRRTAQPEILLLLDGLNEVSTVTAAHGCTVMEMVIGEINYLMRHCPNVRIVLTSRSGDTDIGGSNLTRLHLGGIKTDAISEYLQLQGFSDERIAQALSDPDLAKTLQIPLFLSMYAALSQESSATTQGEILRLFFHERSRNLELYTNQDRLSSLEENAGGAARALQEQRITARMYRFMLDFILPELACYMEKKGLFHLSAADAQKQVQALLTDTGPGSLLGSTGKAVFTDYRRSASRRANVAKTAADLRLALGEGDSEDWELITEGILICCVTTLGILQETNGRCGFVHQHIRDYFAAVRHIHALRIAVHLLEQEAPEAAADCLAPLLRDVPVGMTVRKFMGEYLLEHKNKPLVHGAAHLYGVPAEPCERNLIDRALGIYRGRFEGRDGYSLYSLLKILTQVRGSLAGCDLSRLDLTGCDLNGTGLGIRGLATKLEGAKLGNKELFFRGHHNSVECVDHSPDGKQILSLSQEGTACIHDAVTGTLRQVIEVSRNILSAGFTRTGSHFFTVSGKPVLSSELRNFVTEFSSLAISLWDGASPQHLISRTVALPTLVDVSLSPDRSRLLLWNAHTLLILSSDDLEEQHRVKIPPSLKAVCWQGENCLLLSCALGLQKDAVHLNMCYDLLTRKFTPVPEGLEHIGALAIAVRGENRFYIALEGKERTLKYHRPGMTEFLTLEHLGEYTNSSRCQLSYSSTGRWLVARNGQDILIYDPKNFRTVKTFSGHVQPKYESLSVFDERNQLAVGTSDGVLRLFDIREFTLSWEKSGALSYYDSPKLSPDGAVLAVVDQWNKQLSLWDPHSRRLLGIRKGDHYRSCEMSFSADGKKLLISSHHGGEILLVPDLQPLFQCESELFFSPDGAFLVATDLTGSTVYDGNTYRELFRLEHRLIKGFLPNRVLFAQKFRIETGRRSVRKIREHYSLIDFSNTELLKEAPFEGAKYKIAALCDKYIAFASIEGEILLLSAVTREIIARYAYKGREQLRMKKLRFSWDGAYLLESYWRFSVLRKTDTQEVCATHAGTGDDCILMTSNGGFWAGAAMITTDLPTFRHTETGRPVLVANPLRHSFKSLFATDDREQQAAILESGNRLVLYRLNGPEEARKTGTIQLEPGLEVMGVDLRRLHPDSSFTAEQWEILRTYGAMIE